MRRGGAPSLVHEEPVGSSRVRAAAGHRCGLLVPTTLASPLPSSPSAPLR